MSKRANPAVIGGFVVGAIILAVVVIVIFGSGEIFKQKNSYVIYFDGSANGLDIGAPVKLKGVTIGGVTEISLITRENAEFLVEVVAEVDPSSIEGHEYFEFGETLREVIDALVTRGLRARLEMQSLVLGKLYVKLDYFPDTEVVMREIGEDHIEIPSIPTAQEELERSLGGIVDTLADLQLRELISSLVSTVQSVDSVLGAMNLADATHEFQATAAELNDVLKHIDSNIDPLTGNIEEMTIAAAATVERIDSLMTTIVDVAASDRLALHGTLKEFAHTARALRTLADYLERHPESIIRGKK